MLIMVKFSHRSVLLISSTELFSDLIISPCTSSNKCSYCIPLFFHTLLTAVRGPLQTFPLFPIARMQGRVARMGGLEASDPLQFIPPPTLTLRMGDFLLVFVKKKAIAACYMQLSLLYKLLNFTCFLLIFQESRI